MNKCWYVAYIKHSRNIKPVREIIEGLDCDIWVPTYRYINLEDGEKKEERVSLFPGYVFLCFDYALCGKIGFELEDRSIGYILDEMKVPIGGRDQRGHPIPVSDAEIQLIRDMEQNYIEQSQIATYDVGDIVKIEKGLFVGFEGRIEQLKGENVILEVFVFGRVTPITLKVEDLGKIQRNI